MQRCSSMEGRPFPGKENGYYVGPTIIDYVTPDMRIAQEEVFGPVLVIMRAKDIDTRWRSRMRRHMETRRRYLLRAAALRVT